MKEKYKKLIGTYVTIYQDNDGVELIDPLQTVVTKVTDKFLYCLTNKDELFKVTPEALKAGKNQVPPELANILRTLQRDVNDWADELGEEHPVITVSKFKEQIEYLKKHAYVGEVFFGQTKEPTIIVITKCLPAYDTDWKKTRVKVGRMALIMELGSGNIFRAFNLDYKNTNDDMRCYHPHVEDNGHICFGDAEEGINNSMAMGDIYSAFSVLMEMLTQFDMYDSEYTEWIGYKIRTPFHPDIKLPKRLNIKL